MATTVAMFAAQLGSPTTALIEQLQSAGLKKTSADDTLTEADKERLLTFVRSSHGLSGGNPRDKIALTKKTSTEVKQADASGRARTIQVEVRKKRVFINRDDAAPGSEEASGPNPEKPDLQRREEEARAQAAAILKLEEELAAKRKAREDQYLVPDEAMAADSATTEQIRIPAAISVVDLAHKMSITPVDVIKQLMKLGQVGTIDQQLDQETAMIVAEELGFRVTADQPKQLQSRAPREVDLEVSAYMQVIAEELAELRRSVSERLNALQNRPLVNPLSLFDHHVD